MKAIVVMDGGIHIFLSTRDARVRKLAAELNVHLKELRRQRWRFQQGGCGAERGGYKQTSPITCAHLSLPSGTT